MTEYEDASHPAKAVRHNDVKAFRCAVADGATESAFAGQWARILTEAYCKKEIREGSSNASLSRLREKWRSATARVQLPWYAEQKAATGAFAALVGLTLHDGAEKRWQALAVGDCCLFQVRGGRCVAAFPFDDADAFNNNPYLLSSNHAKNADLGGHLRTASGSWESEDTFYLTSDAIAAWILRVGGRGDAPWDILRDFDTDAQRAPFDTFVTNLRAEGALKNDDVTILRLSCFDRRS